MGGYLADPAIVSWFNFSTPFWVAGILSLIGIGIIYRFSQETLVREEETEKWSLFKTMWVGFKDPNLKIYYFANFFLAFGYFSFFRFLPVFLERVFDFDARELAYVMVYNSLMIGVGIAILIPFLSKRWKPVRSLSIFSWLLSIAFVICLLPNVPLALLATIPPIGFCLAVAITYGALLISDRAPKAFQGQALGTLTSVQVLAGTLTAIVGGVLASIDIEWPLYLGAAMTTLCGFLLIKEWK